MGHWRYLVLIALLAGPVAPGRSERGAHLAASDGPAAEPLDVSRTQRRNPSARSGANPGSTEIPYPVSSFKGTAWRHPRHRTQDRGGHLHARRRRARVADSFTFAVQAVDSPVSAAASITITVSEEPPALSVVHSVDFGSVQVGEMREEQITLRNSGGGILEGRMDVTPPWQILGYEPNTAWAATRKKRSSSSALPTRNRTIPESSPFSHDTRSAVELSAQRGIALRV